MAKRIKKKEPETYEEHLAQAFEHHRTLSDDYAVPEPNHEFCVGDEVIYGRREDCHIEEILEGGRLIHLSYHDRGELRGQPFDNNRRLPILVWWMDVYPEKAITETNFGRPRIVTDYQQFSLDSLIHRAYSRGVIDSPDYQRDYVWSLEDKQRLIKSIFNRTDIGKFVFLDYPHPEWRQEIIDGKQRLRAILDYYEGRFAFQGKTFQQLSGMDKLSFKDIMVQAAYLNASRVKKSDILWLFLSLNRGGVPQTDEHIAKAQALYSAALAEEAK